MNILQKLFTRKAALPAKQDSALPFQFFWTGAGFTMIPANTMQYIRDGYEGNSAVYSVVNALMQKFASVPFYAYKIKSKQGLKQYKAMTKDGYNNAAFRVKSNALEDVPDNDPVAMLLAKPNGMQTDNEFRQMLLCFLKITGGVPIFANMGQTKTKLQSLNVLPSQWVTITPDPTLMDIEKVWFNPYGGLMNEIPSEQVYFIRYVNPDYQVTGSHLYGLSPLKAGLVDMQAGNEATTQMAKMYQNGGARGVLVPKQILTETQVSGLRNSIDTWITGSDNRGKIGGVSAPLDFHNIGLDAVDMALINGKQKTDERICNLYNYPPELLSGDKKFNNYNEAVKYVVTNSLYSDFVAYRDFWNCWVLPMMKAEGYFVDFDISVLPEMQEDFAKMTDQAVKLVSNGLINRNEGRLMLKFDESTAPGMNDFYIGSVPLAEMDLPENVNDEEGDYTTIDDEKV